MKNININIYLFLFIIAGGCSVNNAVNEDPLTVEVTVVTGENQPVENQKIYFNNKYAGRTLKNGSLERKTLKKNGEIILVQGGCPKGMNIQSIDKKEIVVNRVLSVNSKNNIYLPVKVEFRCISEIKEHLVIVKANESDIPVLLFGKEVGKTGKDGIAEFPVKGKQGEEIEVTLNTTLNRDILPQMPSRLFQLPDSSRFFLFEQDFVKRKIKKKKRRRNKRKGPVRL